MTSTIKVTAETDFYTVLDDVLPPAQCDKLWNFIQVQPFRRVEALGKIGHWLIEDGETLRGPTVGWGHKWDAQYPSGSPTDDVMKAIVNSSDLIAGSVGRRDTDWQIFSAMLTVYRAGQGLVWHRDSEDNTGSYIYYAHPEWNIEWGGELLLAHTHDIPREYGVFFHRLRASPQLPRLGLRRAQSSRAPATPNGQRRSSHLWPPFTPVLPRYPRNGARAAGSRSRGSPRG